MLARMDDFPLHEQAKTIIWAYVAQARDLPILWAHLKNSIVDGALNELMIDPPVVENAASVTGSIACPFLTALLSSPVRLAAGALLRWSRCTSSMSHPQHFCIQLTSLSSSLPRPRLLSSLSRYPGQQLPPALPPCQKQAWQATSSRSPTLSPGTLCQRLLRHRPLHSSPPPRHRWRGSLLYPASAPDSLPQLPSRATSPPPRLCASRLLWPFSQLPCRSPLSRSIHVTTVRGQPTRSTTLYECPRRFFDTVYRPLPGFLRSGEYYLSHTPGLAWPWTPLPFPPAAQFSEGPCPT
jgi:hypothetical protein